MEGWLPTKKRWSSDSEGRPLRRWPGACQIGAPDPCKDTHGGIDFRIQRQIKAYNKEDSPQHPVKPVTIIIIVFIMAHAFGDTRTDGEMAITGMITSTFFFLLQPGEYTDTVSDDAAFKLQDVHLYIQGRRLDSYNSSTAELKAAISVSYTFTAHKNGNRNEKIVQGLIGDPWCCPVKATVHLILHHRSNKSRPNAPLAAYYHGERHTLVKAKYVTEVLRNAMRLNVHCTGIEASEISARSL
jgi:hypothetical protein